MTESAIKCGAHRVAGFDLHEGSFLSQAEWCRLLEGLLSNPALRLRRGEAVGRGLVFRDYRRKGRGGAYCCTQEKLDKSLEHKTKMRNDPAYAVLHKFKVATRGNSEAKFLRWYRECKNRSSKRGIDFVLTEPEARELYGHSCFYCGAAAPTGASWGIDRMVNEIGYLFDNCVPCCGVCNHLKGQKNTLDFLAKVGDIAAYRR